MKPRPKKHAQKKRAPAKPSTALARRRQEIGLPAEAWRLLDQAVKRPEPPAPVEEEPGRNLLTNDIALGELGLVEVKLTPQEEAILAKPVDTSTIRVKPTGQPYISHPTYTRWLNEAFGRTGWALVPASKPMLNGKSVVCPYVLYIHGQPAAFAMGEQEYFENNKEQTYGDALESTVASALRRCAKRLGIGLEMWDRDFTKDWLARNTVKVWIEGKDRPQWRRPTDPPFHGEKGASSPRRESPAPAERQAPRQEAPAAHHAHSGDLITEKQVKRLWVIIRNSGRTEEEVKTWLHRRFQIDSTKAITRRDYEYVCSAVESPATLPEGGR